MKLEIRMELDGRLSILLGKTPTGETFQFMNIYQITASNPTGQTGSTTSVFNCFPKKNPWRTHAIDHLLDMIDMIVCVRACVRSP